MRIDFHNHFYPPEYLKRLEQWGNRYEFVPDKTGLKIVKEKGWNQILDEGEIERAITKAMKANPKQVEDYRKGKEKLFGFFVGEVMKETKGKANPKLATEILQRALKN